MMTDDDDDDIVSTIHAYDDDWSGDNDDYDDN